jgi:hypothetical protein
MEGFRENPASAMKHVAWVAAPPLTAACSRGADAPAHRRRELHLGQCLHAITGRVAGRPRAVGHGPSGINRER